MMSVVAQDVERVDCCAHVFYRGDSNHSPRCGWSTALAQEQCPDHWFVKHQNECTNRFLAFILGTTCILTLPSIIPIVSQYNIVRHWFCAKDTSIYEELILIDTVKYAMLYTLTMTSIFCFFAVKCEQMLTSASLNPDDKNFYKYSMNCLALLSVTHTMNFCCVLVVFSYWRMVYLPRLSILSAIATMRTQRHLRSTNSVVVGVPVHDAVSINQPLPRRCSSNDGIANARSVPSNTVVELPQERDDDLYCPLGLPVQRNAPAMSTCPPVHQRL
jgi:hypothetical protein